MQLVNLFWENKRIKDSKLVIIEKNGVRNEEVRMKEIEICLWQLTVTDLQEHCKKLGIKSGKIKQETIEKIMIFYQQETWLEDYFQTLQGFEKEYTELIVKENFVPVSSEVKALKEKYNIKTNCFSYYRQNDDNLKFSINGFIPEIFREKLLKLVPPIPLEFKETKEEVCLKECYATIINKEPMKQIDDFIMYVNTNKVKVTDKTGYVTKGCILKYYEKYEVTDIVRHNARQEDPKNQNDTVIANGIITLLQSAKVVEIKDGLLIIGKNYSKYIQKNKIEKARYLLEDYINSTTINETKRLMNYLYKVNSHIELSSPRQSIIEYIKKFPIEKWVKTYDLKYMFRVKDLYFLRKYTGEVLQKEDYCNWYNNAYYDNFEWGFIDSVLMDYLAILGIVDVTIETEYSKDDRFYLSTKFIKVTEFGAMVLNLIKPNIIEASPKPLIVTEQAEIIIEESPKRLEYELYFERFLSRKKKTKEKSIYELEFMGLVRAYNLGLNLKEIVSYITEESEEIPNNMEQQIKEWLKSLDKVTIKKVTILEAPKEIMKVLVEDANIRACIEKDKNVHVLIKKGKEKELKNQIEKNTYFCKKID